jgi:queuine tRNA-ribosyltransferase
LNLANSAYSLDERPIDEQCGCYTCAHFSRAYLRHLVVAKEMLAATLLSIHNIYTLVELSQQIRQSIIEKRFNEFSSHVLTNLNLNVSDQS